MENVEKYKNGWFACAVNVGYEKKVCRELKNLINHDYWGKYIYDMFIPEEEYVDKKGERKIRVIHELKGIVYIKMKLTQEVYNTIKVDGFRMPLPAKEPIPIPKHQIDKMLKHRKD